jgi:hypothetical protein
MKPLLDEKRLRRKMMLKLLSSPMTLVPMIVGVSAIAGTWAMDANMGLGLFVGLAAFMAAGGAFMTRLIVGGENAAKKAIDELQHETLAEQEKALDELESRLKEDGDKRTEAALGDLRAIAEAFDQEDLWNDGLNSKSAFDIMEGVGRLFDRCVRSLEQTLHLWKLAGKMKTKSARKPMLEQREEIIGEVARSIGQLGKILVDVQKFEGSTESTVGLGRLRDELDQSLDFAKQVEEKVKMLDREFSTAELN